MLKKHIKDIRKRKLMKKDNEYINWLKLTKRIVDKYNLKDIKVQIKEISLFSEQKNAIISKEMLQVKILNICNNIEDKAIYCISENTN